MPDPEVPVSASLPKRPGDHPDEGIPTGFTVTNPFRIHFEFPSGGAQTQEWGLDDGTKVKLHDIIFDDVSAKQALLAAGFGMKGAPVKLTIVLKRE